MLYQYTNDDGKVFNLAPHNNFTIESENIFTTIVGQNGTGKSRLLTSIIEELLSDIELKKLSVTHKPRNIIAISTSPFDRFPHAHMYRYLYSANARKKYNELSEKYSYLGLRDAYSSNFSHAYISKIILSLMESLIYEKIEPISLCNILNYLGYEGLIELEFDIINEWKHVVKQLDSFINIESFGGLEFDVQLSMFKSVLKMGTREKKLYQRFYDEQGNVIDARYLKLGISILEKMEKQGTLNVLSLLFTSNGLIVNKDSDISIIDIHFMLDLKIIKLKNISLQKIGVTKPLLIKEASSGEQSVIMSMLGIASKIENGSLICIDEPEVCLHPAWQEKYIQFLMNTFKDYRGCHFIIATHSPQITSKLKDKNCYVMSMDDGKLIDASTLNNKSIDFQLAHVFKSPGFKNEYLTRELISLITLIAEGKGQEELYSPKITEILALKDVIDDDDPVKELIKMVESVKKELS